MKRTYDSRPVRNKRSRFKGVSPSPTSGRWISRINTGPYTYQLGTFDTEEEAAHAFDQAALKYRGPDTFLNFRDLGPKTDPVIEGNTALLPTSKGVRFRIDLSDLPLVSQYCWHGTRHQTGTIGRDTLITLHALLLGTIPITHRVVHVNHDPLDYRRANLMVIPRAIHHGVTRKVVHPAESIYKGVRRNTPTRWSSCCAGKYLGTFDTPEEAARAYDTAARIKYGPFAALNFPEPGELSCLWPAA